MSEREDPEPTEGFRLREFLDYQREALIEKLQGITDEQARMVPTASSLSLLSLVKHSAVWERRWFQIVVAGRSLPDESPAELDGDPDQDPTFWLSDADTIKTVTADYRQQIAASNEILSNFDLSERCVRSDKVDKNLRWVALHMIEETARHAGHADIIRETIDAQRRS